MARRAKIIEDRPTSRRVGALGALWPFVRPYRGQLAVALAALVLTSAISLVLPLAVRRVVDNFDDGAGLLDQYFGAALAIVALLALGTAGFLAAYGGALASRGHARPLALGIATLAIVQIGLGFLNVALLAPVWLQLVHLLVADGLWILLTLVAVTPQEASAHDGDRLEVDAPGAELGVEARG